MSRPAYAISSLSLCTLTFLGFTLLITTGMRIGTLFVADKNIAIMETTLEIAEGRGENTHHLAADLDSARDRWSVDLLGTLGNGLFSFVLLLTALSAYSRPVQVQVMKAPPT